MPKSLMNHSTILNKLVRPLVRQTLLDISIPVNYVLLSILGLSEYREKVTVEKVTVVPYYMVKDLVSA